MHGTTGDDGDDSSYEPYVGPKRMEILDESGPMPELVPPLEVYTRGVLIDPVARTVVEASVLRDSLDSIYFFLQCTTFDCVGDLYIDDEGCFAPGNGCFNWDGMVIRGRGLLLGVDADGETVDYVGSVALVTAKVGWID